MSNRFNYMKVDEEQKGNMESVRKGAKELEKHIELNCPPSREKSLAITKLEEAIMWANKSITHGGEK